MNLTTLSNVKSWIAQTSSTEDDMLQRLINEASRTVMNYLQRAELGYQTTIETISGKNTPQQPLRNWPVSVVNSLSINNVSIPRSNGPTNFGFSLQQLYGSISGRSQFLGIVGNFSNLNNTPALPYGFYGASPPAFGGGGGGPRPFAAGVNNIIVSYVVGYFTENEAQTVPSTVFQVTPAQTFGTFASDLGVTYASGSALTPVAANPQVGEYIPPNPNGASPTGYYQFAAADANAAIMLSYNWVPYDVEQACIEVVGERYRYRGRIGEASRSMGGQQTASFMVRDGLTASIKQRLDPYKLTWAGG